MKKPDLNSALLEALRVTFPYNHELVQVLVDTLYLDKKSIYRRLRGETPFTLNEAGILTKKLNFSLDNILHFNMGKGDKPYINLQMFFDQDNETYFNCLENFIEKLQTMAEAPVSEYGIASGFLGGHHTIRFPELLKLDYFRWAYLSNRDTLYMHYDEIIIPERMSNLISKHDQYCRCFKHSIWLLSDNIIENIKDDIALFRDMGVLSQENVASMKENLVRWLNYHEELATKGHYEDTGNKFDLYITNLKIDTFYNYYYAPPFQGAAIRTFYVRFIESYEELPSTQMREWLHSLMKVSTLISHTGDKDRIAFFDKQRKLVETL